MRTHPPASFVGLPQAVFNARHENPNAQAGRAKLVPGAGTARRDVSGENESDESGVQRRIASRWIIQVHSRQEYLVRRAGLRAFVKVDPGRYRSDDGPEVRRNGREGGPSG